MLFPRTTLLRARPLVALVRQSPRVPYLVNKRSAYPSTSVPSGRNFSMSYSYQTKSTCDTSSPLEHPPYEYSDLEPGTGLKYCKVYHYAMPLGWTNELDELKICQDPYLHKDYVDFPESYVSILKYTVRYGWSYLVEAGGKFYLSNYPNQLFRLDTPIGLTQVLEHMREQDGSLMGNEHVKEEDLPCESKLLEHPKLNWYRLGPGEWTEEKKARERDSKERSDEFQRWVKERAILKCTRQEYVEWVGMMVKHRAEAGWKSVRDMPQQDFDQLLRAVGHSKGGWKEFAELWETMEVIRAGEEYEKVLADEMAPKKMK